MSAVKWLSDINDIFFFTMLLYILFHFIVWFGGFVVPEWLWICSVIVDKNDSPNYKNMTYVGVNWKCPFYYIIWVCSDIPCVIFLPWLDFIITDTSTLNERGREKRRERKSFITALWTNRLGDDLSFCLNACETKLII